MLALTVWGFFKGLYDANIFASVFDVVRPEARGTAAGFMNAVGWLAGGGSAPLVIGIIAQTPEPRAGDRARVDGLRRRGRAAADRHAVLRAARRCPDAWPILRRRAGRDARADTRAGDALRQRPRVPHAGPLQPLWQPAGEGGYLLTTRGRQGSGSGPVSMPRAARPTRMPHGVGNGARCSMSSSSKAWSRAASSRRRRRSSGRERRRAPGRTPRRRRCRRPIPPEGRHEAGDRRRRAATRTVRLARIGERPEIGDLATAVFHSGDEVHRAQQVQHRLRRQAVRESRKVVEEAGGAKRTRNVGGKCLEVLLVVSEEHRHRQQQRPGAGVDRRASELDDVIDRRAADPDQQRRARERAAPLAGSRSSGRRSRNADIHRWRHQCRCRRRPPRAGRRQCDRTSADRPGRLREWA